MHFTAITKAFIGVLMVTGMVDAGTIDNEIKDIPASFLQEFLVNNAPKPADAGAAAVGTSPNTNEAHDLLLGKRADGNVRWPKYVKYCNGKLKSWCTTCYCNKDAKVVWCSKDVFGTITDQPWATTVCSAPQWGGCSCWRTSHKGLIGIGKV